ncbi:MAG TPA: hypothetical protein VGR37_02850 [Longimicrobiaceae bacterium]|nr:hypothetical protein [Longimicrobiaceae bacterium]
MTAARSAPTPPAGLDPDLQARLASLCEEGRDIWERFDLEVRQRDFHPFVAADYERVLQALLPLRAPGLRFLEWGSATGVITIMADLLGFEAYGIELDPELVRIARDLAARFDSGARFAAGSFLPMGYEWRPGSGDSRLGTIGEGASGYLELMRPLEDFDVVYGFPWHGEEAMMHDVMRRYGGRGALLLLNDGTEGVRAYRDGRLVRPPAA